MGRRRGTTGRTPTARPPRSLPPHATGRRPGSVAGRSPARHGDRALGRAGDEHPRQCHRKHGSGATRAKPTPMSSAARDHRRPFARPGEPAPQQRAGDAAATPARHQDAVAGGARAERARERQLGDEHRPEHEQEHDPGQRHQAQDRVGEHQRASGAQSRVVSAPQRPLGSANWPWTEATAAAEQAKQTALAANTAAGPRRRRAHRPPSAPGGRPRCAPS